MSQNDPVVSIWDNRGNLNHMNHLISGLNTKLLVALTQFDQNAVGGSGWMKAILAPPAP